MASQQQHPQAPLDDKKPQEDAVAVVMVPLPAQGHLGQLLNLSRLIVSCRNDVHVHYASSSIHIRQATLRLHGWTPSTLKNLHFHDLPMASFESLPPNPYSSITYPSHLQPAFDACTSLRKPFSDLINQLSTQFRRVVVIHDVLLSSVVQDITAIPNGESYNFHTSSAFWIYLANWEKRGWDFTAGEEKGLSVEDIPSLEDCLTEEFISFATSQTAGYTDFTSGTLYSTCRLIDGSFMDLLAKEKVWGSENCWAMGPLIPFSIRSHGGGADDIAFRTEALDENNMHKCLKWLDEQAPNSVIYVSFGTTTALKDEQIRELAMGLEQSKQKFIWVLRDADKGDIFEGGVQKLELPEGYEERMAEGKTGIVIRDWAPQLEILAHPSTGGFMSHCGWNSCMESITMGVPMATWPMHSDQPRNAVLITKLLKIGLVAKDWAKRHETVSSGTIENAVRRLMASEEGDEIRTRAREFGSKIRSSLADVDGISSKELNSFVDHFCRR